MNTAWSAINTAWSIAVLVVIVAVVLVVAVRRRRVADAPEHSREDLAAIAENQRLQGGREHGQNVSTHRWADRGGWGG